MFSSLGSSVGTSSWHVVKNTLDTLTPHYCPLQAHLIPSNPAVYTSWSPCLLALYNMAKYCFPNVTLEGARKAASCPQMRTFRYRRLKMNYKLKLFREVAPTRSMAPVLRGMILNG